MLSAYEFLWRQVRFSAAVLELLYLWDDAPVSASGRELGAFHSRMEGINATLPESAALPPLEGWRILQRENTLAAVVHCRQDDLWGLFIAGTNSGSDWMDNLNLFGKADYHEGFYRHAQAVRTAYDALPDAPMFSFVAGHSLGGAAAAVLTCRHFLENAQRLPCLTFGAPRFVRRGFRVSHRHCELREHLLHLQVKGDPVPRRPSGIGIGNWRAPFFSRPGAELRLSAAKPLSPMDAHSIRTYQQVFG